MITLQTAQKQTSTRVRMPDSPSAPSSFTLSKVGTHLPSEVSLTVDRRTKNLPSGRPGFHPRSAIIRGRFESHLSSLTLRFHL